MHSARKPPANRPLPHPQPEVALVLTPGSLDQMAAQKMQVRSWTITTPEEETLGPWTKDQLIDYLRALESLTGFRVAFAKGQAKPVYLREDLAPELDPEKVRVARESPDPVSFPPDEEKEKLTLSAEPRSVPDEEGEPVAVEDILNLNEEQRLSNSAEVINGERIEATVDLNSPEVRAWERKNTAPWITYRFLRAAILVNAVWYLMGFSVMWVLAKSGPSADRIVTLANVHANLVGNPFTVVPLLAGAFVATLGCFLVIVVMRQ